MFLVGVGGAVPHYTDFNRHVRLGDVVMSAPPLDGPRYHHFIFPLCISYTTIRHHMILLNNIKIYFRFIYQYCENVTERPIANKSNSSEIQFETKSWCPVDLTLQEIAHALVEKVKPFELS